MLSLLVEAGVATEEELRLAVAEGMGTGERMGQLVLSRGLITEHELAKLLARQWGLAFLDEEVLELAVVERDLLPAEEARRLAGCVVGLTEDQQFVVLADPNSERLRELRELLGTEAVFAVITHASLQRLLDRLSAEPDRALDIEAETGKPSAVFAAEDGQTDGLMAEVEAAQSVLGALVDRVEQLTAERRAADDEAAKLREELAREQQRSAAIRQKLTHLLREIDDA